MRKIFIAISLLLFSFSISAQQVQDSVKTQPLSDFDSIEVDNTTFFPVQFVRNDSALWAKFSVKALRDAFQSFKLPRTTPFDGQALVFVAGEDSLGYKTFVQPSELIDQDSTNEIQVLSIDSTATTYSITLSDGGVVTFAKGDPNALTSESDPLYSADSSNIVKRQELLDSLSNVSSPPQTLSSTRVSNSNARPIFIETFFLPYGNSGAPANASLNEGTYIGTWPFSATEGTNYVVSDSVANFGANQQAVYPLVLQWVDGTDTTYQQVITIGHNGSDTVWFEKNLDKTCTDCRFQAYHLSSDQQHLTQFGTKLFVDQLLEPYALNASGKIIYFMDAYNNATYDIGFVENDSLETYGTQVANGVVSSINRSDAVANTFSTTPSGQRLIRPYVNKGRLRVGVHDIGQGIENVVQTKGVNGIIKLKALVNQQGVTSPDSLGISGEIRIYGDTNLVYSDIVKENIEKFEYPFSGYDSVRIEFVSTVDNEFYLDLYDVYVISQEENTGQTIDPNAKIVVMGDSWTKYHNDIFATYLQSEIEKRGGNGEVINQGLGGRTTKWALDYFDSLVVKQNPDVVIIEYFTNDQLGFQPSFEFSAPEGGTKDYSILGGVSEWKANIKELIRRTIEIGATPIVMLPSPTGSFAQAQAHSEWNLNFLPSTYLPQYYEVPLVKNTALSDTLSYRNNYGKRIGSLAIVDTTLYISTGSNKTDVWQSVSGSGGGISDGDKGDITVSGLGAIWSIDNGVVGPSELAATSVSAGSYTSADITVDADGRITSAANGTSVGGGLSGSGTTNKIPVFTSSTSLGDGKITQGVLGVTINGELAIDDLANASGVVTKFLGATTANRLKQLSLGGEFSIAGGTLKSLPDSINYWKLKNTNYYLETGGVRIGSDLNPVSLQSYPSKLIIADSANTGFLELRSTKSATVSGDILSKIDFYNSDNSGHGNKVQSSIQARAADAFGRQSLDIFVSDPADANNMIKSLSLESGGNIGFGVAGAAYKVDVLGDINLTGDYYGVTNPLGGTNTVQASLDSLDTNVTDLSTSISQLGFDTATTVNDANSFISTWFTNNPETKRITQTVGVPSGATSDAEVTFPDPSATYLDKEIEVIPFDESSNFDVVAKTVAANGIRYDTRQMTSVRIPGGTRFRCVQIPNTANYVWNTVSTPKTTGFETVSDTVYTEASPLVINQGDTATFTLKGIPNRKYLPPAIDSLIDAVNNKLLTDKVGSTFMVRIGFNAKSSSITGDYTMRFKIGGEIVILARVSSFPKGANVTTPFNTSSATFSLGTFLSTGMTIDIISNEGNTSIFGGNIFYEKVTDPNN